jgi:hypothetical protein
LSGLPNYFKLLAQIWPKFEFFKYISLVFSFYRFFATLQNWIAGALNNIICWFRKWYSWYLVYIEAVFRNSHELSSIFLPWHDEQHTGKVFLNYRKSVRSPKITKLIGVSCYHMYRLCATIEKISSKLRHLMPKTQTSPHVIIVTTHLEMSGF